ncbi:MAG: hypothetical protein IPK50_06030 [Fibrobacterota bacterium]|nr:hypothetical protein [Fibrobacterota bacterium]QQS06455.1 MAG: hypothetical protein IPK50_06030 [Fibrobacterota bacterium]
MLRFRSAAMVQMAGSMARLAALFLAGRWIAHKLGATGVATMGQVQNLVALASALGVQALQSGFQQGAAARTSSRARAAWRSSGILLGSLLVFAGSAAVALSWRLELIALPFAGGWWIPLLPILILPNVWIAAWQGDALGRAHWTRASLWNAGSGILQALFWGGAVALWGIAGLVGAILSQALFLAPFASRFLAESRFVRPPRLGVWWKAWLPLLLAGAAPSITVPLAGIILRTLMLHQGWEGAGIWQAAARIPELLFPMWNGVVGAWVLSRVAGPDGHKGLHPSILLQAFAGSLGLSMILWLGAAPILHLAYGEGFERAIPLLRLQAFSELPRTLAWIFAAALLGRSRAKDVILLEFVGFSVLCGGAFLLHGRWGLMAPALASIVDNFISLALAAGLWIREKRRAQRALAGGVGMSTMNS